jgi:hypothetical protein
LQDGVAGASVGQNTVHGSALWVKVNILSARLWCSSRAVVAHVLNRVSNGLAQLLFMLKLTKFHRRRTSWL